MTAATLRRESDAGGPSAPNGPRRVLIVLLGAIGDVVRGLPLAQRIRSGWPQARIAWAVEPAAAPVLEGHPAVDEAIRFDRGGGLPAFARFARQVRAWAPDVALDLQRHLKSGVATWLSGAPIRVGFHWRNSREGNWFFSNRHIAPVSFLSSKLEHYLLFADLLGVPPAPLSFGLAPTAEERERAGRMLAGVARPFAAVCPGASWTTKQWFPEPTAAVCRGLSERGLGVVLLGGPGDVEFAAAVTASRPGPVLDLAGRSSLRDAIAILDEAAVAVGPDSGPMHICAALGTPVVSLWGATSPARSGPAGYADLVVPGRADCSPCYKRRCPIDRACMRAITPEAVLAQVDRALAT